MASKLTDANVNANIGNPFSWYRDNNSLLVKMIPSDRGKLIDNKKDLPNGPIVSMTEGKSSQNRTFQDLLKNKTDEFNFTTLVRSEIKSQLMVLRICSNHSIQYVGQSFSPDGNYIMISTISKPYSYIVPWSKFPMKTIVYDLNGKEIKTVNEVPLTEVMPKGFAAVRTVKEM